MPIVTENLKGNFLTFSKDESKPTIDFLRASFNRNMKTVWHLGNTFLNLHVEDKYQVTAPQSLAGKMPNKADTKVIEINEKIPPGVTPRGNTSSSSKCKTLTIC